ncbi:MAG TPA: permease-like cell division protein FtsX [Gemmatimonadaceae bacterium]|nr:permease-like cell division protein FtsX [Gemmatimonadaceae bacterium]
MRLTLRETALGLRHAPLLSTLSVITIAFSLFTFGLFGLVALNVSRTLRGVEERVEIRAFIADGTPVEAVAAALGDIGAFPEVQSAVEVTSDEALARARKEMPEFQDVFQAGVLPASIEVRLRPGYRDPATVQAVASRIQTYPFVDDIRYGQEWVVKLYNIRNVAGATGLVLGVAFAAVSIIIIGSTIRLAVLAREREISIMRLVGATNGFIRRPFLIDGLLKGLLGGGLALLLTWLAHLAIDRYLIPTTFFDRNIAILGVVCGGLIGLVGSALSVGRHLRGI